MGGLHMKQCIFIVYGEVKPKRGGVCTHWQPSEVITSTSYTVGALVSLYYQSVKNRPGHGGGALQQSAGRLVYVTAP